MANLHVPISYFSEHFRTVNFVGTFVFPEESHPGGFQQSFAPNNGALSPINSLDSISACDVSGSTTNQLPFIHFQMINLHGESEESTDWNNESI